MACPPDRFRVNAYAAFPQRHGKGYSASGIQLARTALVPLQTRPFSLPSNPQQVPDHQAPVLLTLSQTRSQWTPEDRHQVRFAPCCLQSGLHRACYTAWPINTCNINVQTHEETEPPHLCTRIWTLERQGPRCRMAMDRKGFFRTHIQRSF